MKTPFLRLVACLPFAIFVLFACQKNVSTENSDRPSPLQVFLTDHQTPLFDSVFIDLQKLEVKLEDTLSDEGWVNLSIRSGIYDILRFRNGADTLMATGTLPNTRIRKLRLTLGGQNRVVLNGQSQPLLVKSNNRQVVMNLSEANVDVSGGGLTFWLDFDAANSIQVNNSGSGNANGFELKASLKAFGKSNSGRIEGKVGPASANPIVKAVMGADTATALPERSNGEFKIVGLKAGTYTVLLQGQNGYRDTVINNVRVVAKEDAKLPTMVLHQ